jgi:hypothetical protein
MQITDEMVNRALDACGRHPGHMGPVRMRAALEAALATPEDLGTPTYEVEYDIETELDQMGWLR